MRFIFMLKPHLHDEGKKIAFVQNPEKERKKLWGDLLALP